MRHAFLSFVLHNRKKQKFFKLFSKTLSDPEERLLTVASIKAEVQIMILCI